MGFPRDCCTNNNPGESYLIGILILKDATMTSPRKLSWLRKAIPCWKGLPDPTMNGGSSLSLPYEWNIPAEAAAAAVLAFFQFEWKAFSKHLRKARF